jgi:hypothetical protein
MLAHRHGEALTHIPMHRQAPTGVHIPKHTDKCRHASVQHETQQWKQPPASTCVRLHTGTNESKHTIHTHARTHMHLAMCLQRKNMHTHTHTA